MFESNVWNEAQGKRSGHRVILQVLPVILHLVSLKSVYEKYIRFEVQICYTAPKLPKYYENDGNYMKVMVSCWKTMHLLNNSLSNCTIVQIHGSQTLKRSANCKKCTFFWKISFFDLRRFWCLLAVSGVHIRVCEQILEHFF